MHLLIERLRFIKNICYAIPTSEGNALITTLTVTHMRKIYFSFNVQGHGHGLVLHTPTTVSDTSLGLGVSPKADDTASVHGITKGQDTELWTLI